MPLLHLSGRPRPSRPWRSSWAVTAALAVLAGSIAAVASWRGEHAARALGDRHLVAVVEVARQPGDVLADAHLRWRTLPALALPPSAVTSDPTGRVVTSPLVVGEVLVEERLAPTGRHGPAALAPPGSRLVAVPLGPSSLVLSIGDVVDLLAVAVHGGPSTWVARRAVVVEVDVGEPGTRSHEGTVTVAVAAADAADVAAAAFTGGLTAVLVPPS